MCVDVLKEMQRTPVTRTPDQVSPADTFLQRTQREHTVTSFAQPEGDTKERSSRQVKLMSSKYVK